jgi:glucokinase
VHSFVTGEFDAVHSGRQALTQNTHYQVTEGIAEGAAASQEPALLGTNSSPFAAEAGNLAVIGFPTDGVYLPGTGAACSFSGYLVVE